MSGLAPAEILAALIRGECLPWSDVARSSEEFRAACLAHDVVGLLERAVAGRPHGDWPDEVLTWLREQVLSGGTLELIRQREVAAVLEALFRHGITPVLLKGTPLAYSVYSRPHMRPRCDTDLLVPREHVERTRETLIGLGYSATPYCDGELLFCQFELRKHDRFGVLHAFDVHWKVSTQPVFAGILDYDEMLRAAEPVPALGPHALTAGRVHALLLASVHPAMHHRNVERLIWTHDVHLLAGRLGPAEWESLGALAAARGVAGICAHELSRARTRFLTCIPEAVLTGMAARAGQEESIVYLRAGRRWHHELLSSLRALPRWPDRMRLVREVLLPSPDYMRSVYGLTNRRLALGLAPALYLHRGLNGAWKVLANRK